MALTIAQRARKYPLVEVPLTERIDILDGGTGQGVFEGKRTLVHGKLLWLVCRDDLTKLPHAFFESGFLKTG